MFGRSTYKAYLKELSAIKEYYNPKSQRKFNKNRHWKDEWKGYAEYTFPWDGGNILESIVFRLEVLAANLKYYSHHEGSEAEVEEILQTVALGKKILDEDTYYKIATDFSVDHCATYCLVFDKKTREFIGECKIIKSKDPKADWFIGSEKQLIEWCTVHNLEYKDISTAVEGRWDDSENHDRWTGMLDNAAKKRKADIKKFFNILADKLESWWD